MTHTSLRPRVASISVGALMLAALSAPAMAQEKKFKAVWVKTPDGLTISAQDWGNPNEPEILFIHGFSQSHLSWIKQVTSDLAKDFHMVTYDLRGHGNSDKPFEPERYKDSKAWGTSPGRDGRDRAQAPGAGWLVLWRPHHGRLLEDTRYGQACRPQLCGRGQKADPSFVGPNLKNLPLMASEDLATNIAATRAFLRDCFSKQPTQEEFEMMLSFNMMVPPKVRFGLSNRPLEIDELLKSLKLPVLVTHGSEDKNSNLIAAEYTAKIIPGANTTLADLFTLLFAANPFSAVRASLRQWSSDEVEDGLAHGGQCRPRRQPVDSFFPALLF